MDLEAVVPTTPHATRNGSPPEAVVDYCASSVALLSREEGLVKRHGCAADLVTLDQQVDQAKDKQSELILPDGRNPWAV
jgi:hypothetical protein